MLESTWVTDGQHVLKCRDRANATDLTEPGSFWILLPSHTLDGFIEAVDLSVQVGNGLKEYTCDGHR